MKEVLEEPNWILLTLIGAIVGYGLPYFFNLISFIYRSCYAASFLEGKWFSYYKIYENREVVLKTEEWIIRTGFKDKLKVRVDNMPKKDLSYKGIITEEKGQLLFELNALQYREKAYCRYSSPIPGNDSIMKGFWL